MPGIGLSELLIILVIVLVVFGGGKLPEIGAGLGKAIKDFRKATSEPEEIDLRDKSPKDGSGAAEAKGSAPDKDEPKA